MNTKEIAKKYSLNQVQFDQFILCSDLKYKNSVFNGIEVLDDPQTIVGKYREYLKEKEQQAIAEKLEEELRKKEIEKEKEIEASQIKEKMLLFLKRKEILQSFPVTTVDLKEDYDILDPIQYQISNKGGASSALSVKKKEYAENYAFISQHKEAIESGASLLADFVTEKNDFDQAYSIAIEEMKLQAFELGADAVIGMRQNICFDPNDFTHFYLQIYGTAVKKRKNETDNGT